MIAQRATVIAGIFLVAFLTSAGCVRDIPVPDMAGSTALPSPGVTRTFQETATKEEMVAFVREAVAYAQASGKERALPEFSNRSGAFFRGVLYIYAYDFNGTTIAHPVNPEMIGVNRIAERDAKGNLFIKELRDTALNGSGFVEYSYINPVHNNTVEPKLGYVMKVDDTWWLGSGIYGSLNGTKS
jgi:cytochrome c